MDKTQVSDLIFVVMIDTLHGANIHWRNVQRKNVVKNVDMSSLRAQCHNGPYKSQHSERHKNT